MPDSQEQKEKEHNPEVNDHDEPEEDETTPSSEPSTSSKSKTKKMKSKLKSLLSRKGNEEIRVDEIQETLASASLEDKKALSVDDQEKLRLLMKRVNEMVPPGAKKDIADHKFWKTQPVIKFDEIVAQEGQIEPPQPEKVPKDPIKLPGDLEFVTMDLTNESEVQEVYELLSGHYVEDNDASFRFAYTAGFFKWALLTPDYKKELHVGLRATHNKNRKLCGFISGIPITLRIRNNTIKTVEINFLCIHKKLRSKRLAPVLIKEVTRRCHLEGIWEAVYTAGVVPSKPISTCRYYHRPLDWLKLYETGFSPLPPRSTKERMVLRNKLPENTSIPGIRLMEEKDVASVTKLLDTYLAKFDLAPVYTEEEVRHWLLHKGNDEGERVIWTYVVPNPSNDDITDFISFYSLPSTVLNNKQHSILQAAYLFYYATATPAIPRPAYQKRLQALVQDTLISAKKLGFDVFNGLTLLDNGLFLEELKFGGGDGHLNFYLYNYRTKPIAGGMTLKGQIDPDGSGIALVML